MLRVCSIAGEELASVSTQEVKYISALKHMLRRLHGFPLCMQRLLSDTGSILNDSLKLEGDAEIQLVLLSLSTGNLCNEAALELISCASEPGHLKTARMLLEAGVNKDICRQRGKTVLMHAAQNGQLEIAQLLVEASADIDARDWDRETALMYACDSGHVEIVRLLLEAGADNDLSDLNGNTALVHASARGHTEISRLLMPRRKFKVI